MHDYWSLEEANLSNTWLTIGSFDGVHRGHQAIIHRLVQLARAAGTPSVVLTFHPHPAQVLRNRHDPIYLSTPEERAGLLGEMGVDFVVTHPFTTQLASQSAREFMTLVVRQLHPQHVLVGYDFALGRNREGNVEHLSTLGAELGYSLDVLQQVTNGGEAISSSEIRARLAEGDVQKAWQLLGRPYQVGGPIIPGDGRGRLLGVPTANLDLWSLRMLPKSGVYVCQAHIEGRTWGAVTNVGVRPTFENQSALPRVETHVLGLQQELYGKQVRLDFLDRLRDEKRFPDVGALVAQIRQDVQTATEILSTIGFESK